MSQTTMCVAPSAKHSAYNDRTEKEVDKWTAISRANGRVENGNDYFIQWVDGYTVLRFTTFLGLSCVYISKVLR